MRILAISGSLRTHSANSTLLKALRRIAQPEIEIVIFDSLEDIPPFNPDKESDGETGAVARLRTELREASAVVFSTPEYAHGVPGVLKNALDWVVGSGELAGKPVALVNASSRAIHAQASLRETLSTMDACVLIDAEVTVPLSSSTLTVETIVSAEETLIPLRRGLAYC